MSYRSGTVTVVTNAKHQVQHFKEGEAYTTIVLPPPSAATSYIALVNDQGRLKQVLHGQTHDPVPHRTATLLNERHDLTDLSEQEAACGAERAKTLTPAGRTAAPGAHAHALAAADADRRKPVCAWCRQKYARVEDMMQCKQCKTALYCHALCGWAHWCEGDHATQCRVMQ
jgi:hypothetical protein